LSIVLKADYSFADYIYVLKPRETSLILIISACSALVAASTLNGVFPIKDFILTVVAIALGGAGANGLTNYLDRNVDALMKRTCNRILPAKHIRPPEKVLALALILIIAGLVMAWFLSPICFFIGLVGVLASGIWRKTISCTFFGIVAGSAPILIGWYAITRQPSIDVMPALLFCMIACWTPTHVWTLMIANREDYESAGLHYFPLSFKDADVIKMLAVLSIALSIFAVLVYFLVGKFHWLYLCVAVILSLIMIIANLRLLFNPTSRNAWTIYKLSAFPYLGIIFTVMAIDAWLI
jgi:protoheme IX farnesyltransferase